MTPAEVLDDDVAVGDQTLAASDPALLLEVEHDALFLPAEIAEIGGCGHRAAAVAYACESPCWLLDLQHLGAALGQQPRAIGTGDQAPV